MSAILRQKSSKLQTLASASRPGVSHCFQPTRCTRYDTTNCGQHELARPVLLTSLQPLLLFSIILGLPRLYQYENWSHPWSGRHVWSRVYVQEIYCIWRPPLECFKTCPIIVLMIWYSLLLACFCCFFDFLGWNLEPSIFIVICIYLSSPSSTRLCFPYNIFVLCCQWMENANQPRLQFLERSWLETPYHQAAQTGMSALTPNTWTQRNTDGWITLVSRPKPTWKPHSQLTTEPLSRKDKVLELCNWTGMTGPGLILIKVERPQ